VKVQEYLLEDGSSPYKKWFDALDPEPAAKAKLKAQEEKLNKLKKKKNKRNNKR
jgi:hypothetical protein